MKKIILFVALATLGIAFNACSSDDSESSSKVEGRITVKIDNVSTTFDNINIIAKDTTDNEVEFRIIATKGNDLSESIRFTTYKEATGADRISYFYYNTNDKDFYVYNSNDFSTHIITNNDGKLIGTFSGTVTSGGEEKTLTDGTFNITY